MSNYNGLEVEIIFEDENILAVNKPPHLVIHTDGRTVEPTLSDWVVEKYPDILTVGGLHTLDNERYENRAGILHRIDRETSGVVLIAKNDDSFWKIQQQFTDHSIQKIYLAFCEGAPLSKEGTIDFEIGRSKSDYRQWTVPPFARGTLRAASTMFEVISEGEYEGKKYSLIKFMPKTGRTHQIRVHAKAAGFPIVSDKRYESNFSLSFGRVALHAHKLVFKHPVTGNRVELEASLPLDFINAKKLLNIN